MTNQQMYNSKEVNDLRFSLIFSLQIYLSNHFIPHVHK